MVLLVSALTEPGLLRYTLGPMPEPFTSPGRNAPCPCGSGRRYRQCCGELNAHWRHGTVSADPIRDEPLAELEHLRALALAGRLGELEAAAAEYVARRPEDGYGWQFLGIAKTKQGKDALHELQTAAACLPHDAIAQVNFGNALGTIRKAGPRRVRASFRRSISSPHSPRRITILPTSSWNRATSRRRSAVAGVRSRRNRISPKRIGPSERS